MGIRKRDTGATFGIHRIRSGFVPHIAVARPFSVFMTHHQPGFQCDSILFKGFDDDTPHREVELTIGRKTNGLLMFGHRTVTRRSMKLKQHSSRKSWRSWEMGGGEAGLEHW